MTPLVHALDFEGHPSYGVVEYGVVTLREGQIVDVRTAVCAARSRIRLGDISIHRLDDHAVAAAPPFDTCHELFVSLRRTGVFAAHNASMEHQLLRATWPFPPLVPHWKELGREVAEWGPYLDTVFLARHFWPNLASHALTDLVSELGLEARHRELANLHCPPSRRQPHCALYDALACALILQSLAVRAGVGERPEQLLFAGRRAGQQQVLF